MPIWALAKTFIIFGTAAVVALYALAAWGEQ
jgi:hypothetical protein